MKSLAWLRAELPRKAIHMLSGSVPLAYAALESRRLTLAILAVMCLGMGIVEWQRRRPGWLGKLFYRWFGAMLRARELSDRGRLLAATNYCLASLACVALFPMEIAVLALLYLAVGDTAAALFGRAFGRVRIGHKTLEGALACCLACGAVAWGANAWSPEYPIAAGLAGAVAAAFAELLLTRLDDNWTMPLGAGAVMAGWLWLT